MEFWIFMFIFELFIPVMLILFGRYFIYHAPKKINMVYGYRTKMSMKNTDTWEFAHHYCGKIWFYSGLAMLIISIVVMTFVLGKDNNFIGAIGCILCMLQMIPLISSIILTEFALKKNFDEYGNRR